ncbi:MAG: tetratricopeptide repeat protein [Asgard group archaeon]|nr:tetratricopeptide repeat protein [Asgard group archaeon]
MSVDGNVKLLEIHKLINKGQYPEALNIIEESLKNSLSDQEKNQLLFLKCLTFTKRSNFTDCIELINNILVNYELNLELHVDFLLLKANALMRVALFDDEYEVINKIEELIADYQQASGKLEEWLGSLHLLKGWFYVNKTKFDEALNHLQNSFEIFEELQDFDNLATTTRYLGSLYLRMSEINKALDYYQKNLEFRERLGNKFDIADALSLLGMYYSMNSRYSEALSYYDRALNIIEESENNYLIGNIYNSLGLLYYQIGDLNKAFEFYEKALFYIKQLENKQNIAYVLSNIGNVQRLRGNIDEALVASLECLDVFSEIKSIQNMGAKLIDIGNIFLQKGQKQKALAFLIEGLEYRKKTDSNRYISDALYNLIKYYCYIGNKIEAERYLKELTVINEQENNVMVDQKTKIAEALVLKLDNRSKSIAKAEELLTEIVKSEIIDFNSYIDAFLSLCEILVRELKMTNDQEVLHDLNDLIEKLENTAQKQQSFWLQTEVYWIKAKLALIDWDINGAQQLLTKAQLIADEKGFNLLAKKISQEFDRTLNQMELWKQLREKDASVVERLEITELDDLLDNLKQQIINLDDLPAEQPVILLIIKESGEPIFNKNFLPKKIITDDSLISGFLTSINAFFKEVFEAAGSIERIKHHDLTILLKPVEPFLFCYVFKGQSYSAIKKIDQFVNLLQNNNRDTWMELVKQAKIPKIISSENMQTLDEIADRVF